MKLIAVLLVAVLAARMLPGEESLWIEAEHLQGVSGYCWPAGPDPKTDGRWGISGPGWAAEWTQGGESGFLSIACGPGETRAIAGTTIEVPVAGTYRVWVRYRDNREATSRFQVRISPPGREPVLLSYGARPVVEEDNEMKLYWDWAFAWEGYPAELPAGPARLDLLAAFPEKRCRQVDCFVLTTDAAFRPRIKERPRHPTRELLDSLAKGIDPRLEPLARRLGDFALPEPWRPRTFRDRGFLYLWNMGQVKWCGEDPRRVPVPYQVGDKETLEAFEKKYAGRVDVPIFGDPRIVPTFHGSGPQIFATDDKDPAKAQAAKDFIRWLDAHPDRPWALMMNYAADAPLTPATIENFLKYRDRFVGNIAGESLGYFYPQEEVMKAATAGAKTRRELAAAFSHVALSINAEKYRKVFGGEWPDAYREVIPCQSIGMTAFAPLCYAWGARAVGYESAACTSGLLSMRMAFLRGAARQGGGLTATYRSCNFGDASTIFSEAQSYTKPKNILDNFYGVYSGAGMTWYKMDLWYQYMSGSSLFYHEQGFDEFWMPGGTAAAGMKEVQLSPKGKLVDRFLRVTAEHNDRGTPFTPVAFLVDHAHGWDPAPFQPHAFEDFGKRPDLTLHGDHEQQLGEYFWAAYHPIGARSEEPITATSEVYVPGVFGDIFDVVYAYPDGARWTTLATHPVAIAAGDIDLTTAEGDRLAAYVEGGGTLLVADGHLTGPGLDRLSLPRAGERAEADEYRWTPTDTRHRSQRFRYRPIEGGRALATTLDGKVFCASMDRGNGRLIFLSVPRGLGIDRAAMPVLAHLLAHLTRGLMPVEVSGGVEWMVNGTESGWLVTILNPAGQSKPQQGITPTDFRENRAARIRCAVPVRSASDWLFPDEELVPRPLDGGAVVEAVVPAGGVRIVELKVATGGAAAEPEYRIETIAGNGRSGDLPEGGGPALEVPVDLPFGLAAGPDGAIYITCVGSHRVMRLDRKTLRLTSAAGNGKKGYSGDGGPAAAASLNEPYEVRFDSGGNMLILEMQNHLLRRMDARSGSISTIAGDGTAGYGGDGGPAAKARFQSPHSFMVDADDGIYVSDLGNHRVRKIDSRTGLISTVVGNGKRGLPEDGGLAGDQPFTNPQGLALRDGKLWIASNSGHSIWRFDIRSGRIHRVAGTGQPGHAGDGGDPLQATFDGPRGVWLTSAGVLCVAEGENNVIRAIDTERGTIRTIAGAGPKLERYAGDGRPAVKAPIGQPHGVLEIEDGQILISDTKNHRVRLLKPR